MKRVVAVVCFIAVAVAPLAFGQDKGGNGGKASVAAEKSAKSSTNKAPTEKQKAQQARMKDCASRAGDRKGGERNAFMSSCMKGGNMEAAVAGKKATRGEK